VVDAPRLGRWVAGLFLLWNCQAEVARVRRAVYRMSRLLWDGSAWNETERRRARGSVLTAGPVGQILYFQMDK
jgi:hypothetical protein